MISPTGRYQSFDAVAAEYDQTRVIPDSILDDVARLSAVAAGLTHGGGRFLDAGVGTGRFGAPLSRLYPGQIVGADISLPMMRRAREKASGGLALTVADLQRLPFQTGAFQGLLLVHILHLIERWTLVLDEAHRVLAPRTGVLLLGGERGSRSRIVDHYYALARAKGVLRPSLGAPVSQALAVLRRTACVEQVSAPYLHWKRRVTAQETLNALADRTYSQMWSIPDDIHRQLLAEAAEYARSVLGSLQAVETLPAQFVLYAIRWP